MNPRYETCRNCFYFNIGPIATNAGTREAPIYFAECRHKSPVADSSGKIFPITTNLDWCGDFENYDGPVLTYDHSERPFPNFGHSDTSIIPNPDTLSPSSDEPIA